jgi:hypothetical protein
MPQTINKTPKDDINTDIFLRPHLHPMHFFKTISLFSSTATPCALWESITLGLLEITTYRKVLDGNVAKIRVTGGRGGRGYGIRCCLFKDEDCKIEMTKTTTPSPFKKETVIYLLTAGLPRLEGASSSVIVECASYLLRRLSRLRVEISICYR